MEKLINAVKSMHFLEIMLLLLTFLALMVRFIFKFESTFFMEIFAILLALAYFPFGFYFVKKPSQNYSNNISVILGFIYALGIITILISAANIDSNRYPLIVDYTVLGVLVIYLLFQLRSAAYPATYINTQFIRITYIIVCSLFVLIK